MKKTIKKIINFPFKKIHRFFLWSSGANLEVLEQAPTDKNKFFGIGGTIVFTALMASFAGGYAFFTAFREEVYVLVPEAEKMINGVMTVIPAHQVMDGYTLKSQLLSVFFGLFWGALIFNLDRYIVSTFGVGDGKTSISLQEFAQAFPRLLMAIILGFVISTPLELKIFEKEIQTKVQRLKIEKKLELIATDSTFNNEVDKAKKRQTEIENRITYLRSNKKKMMENDVSFIENRKRELESDLNQKDNELKLAQQRLNSGYNRYITAQRDTTNRYSQAQKNSLNKTYRDRIVVRNQKRNEKTVIEEEITSLEKDKESQLRDLSSQLNKEIEDLNTEKGLLLANITSMNSTQSAKNANYDNVSENYDGFAAHLEALSLITEEKPIIFYSKWLITLLFIFIEIAPILFKMMTARGHYDDIMDRIKHEGHVKELLLKSNINQEVNTAVKVQNELNAQKLKAELLANEELLKQIAQSQAEIAKAAIESWKQEQLLKVEKDPSVLIKS